MIQSQLVTRILRKSTPALIASVMAIGLLAGASPGLAVTMTWTNGSALWTSTSAWTTNLATGIDPVNSTNITCGAGAVSNITSTCVGGNGVPGIDDQARFTNNTSYTVTLNIVTNISVVTVTNSAGTVTLDASGSSLTVTGRFRVGEGSATSTVLWAGGTLIAGTGGAPLLQVGTADTNTVGTLIVTNGVVAAGGSVSLGTSPGSIGKLVVNGSGVFTNAIGAIPNNNWNLRLRAAGSQLIITNGGTFFWPDQVRAQSNSQIIVSGPTSSLNTRGIATSTLTIGDLVGPGCLLIVSNGAKVVSDNGTISVGRNDGSGNTGIVVGAGSQLISRIGAGGTGAGITIGLGSAVHNGNDLIVYDGGYVSCDGSFFNISGTGTNCSFHMGGTGAMSTGLVVAVRHNSQALNSSMVMSNAFFTCTKMSVNGSSSNKLSVLANATLNVNAPNAFETNGVSVSAVQGSLIIDAGTLNAVVGSPTNTVNVGGSGTLTGNSLVIRNGGNLFADAVRVQGGNTIAFTSGTLSVGAMDIRPNANGSNIFVVGDGIGAAYYDMAANGGDGYHGFSNGGVVFTNGTSLRGSGTLSGTLVVNGTFVPGFANAVGSVVTSNSLTFGSSAVLEYDLGTSSDSVTVNANLALGNSTINVTDSGGFGANTYVLFTHTNTVVSGTLNVGTLPAGYSAIVSNDADNIPPRTLLVVSVTGPSDPYASWTTHYGIGAGQGNADPDADGMNNTNEFLAGFAPNNNAAYLHVISVAKTTVTNITVTYLGASGDTGYTGAPSSRTNVLEFTTGAGGNYSNNFVSTGQTNILSGGTGVGTVASFVDTNATSGATKYYRVRVLVP
jgi:hypothetical protein